MKRQPEPSPEQLEAIQAYAKHVATEIKAMLDRLQPFASGHAAVVMATLTDTIGSGIAKMLVDHHGGGATREQWVEATMGRLNTAIDADLAQRIDQSLGGL